VPAEALAGSSQGTVPPDEPCDVAPLVHLIGAWGNRVLPGRLDKDRLSFGEQAMVTAMRAPIGNYWD
jgi:menaquinone-dependent protoporphyrinogen oxidase